ncbi:hypothetical protein ATANTOWER_013418 [Ataeniobius toweri]|uniref:Uncharacterized protein n=1 Tax=Ataeniobius toweri TaxID=208326 RepID=A0ABU7AVF0_9TELE|nr:hypothetical protein [Ataeniobius toweri]
MVWFVVASQKTIESRVLCKLHDISEGEEAGCAAEPGELGGRCCTCFESGRTGSHRVAHVQSIPAREERRESIRVSLLHSCSPSLSSPSLRRPQRISVTNPGNGLIRRALLFKVRKSHHEVYLVRTFPVKDRRQAG